MNQLDFSKVLGKCIECEQEFVKLDKRQQYCSVDCRRKANNRNQKLKAYQLKGRDLFAA